MAKILQIAIYGTLVLSGCGTGVNALLVLLYGWAIFGTQTFGSQTLPPSTPSSTWETAGLEGILWPSIQCIIMGTTHMFTCSR